MEKDQCICTKRKYLVSSNHTSSSPTSYPSFHDDSSWEEQAFAKDAAGLGCIWPPRSYSCSFCRREFRSAQALGGHMNVHRRDRAKINQLQQSSPQKNEQLLSRHELQTIHPHNHVQNSLTSGYIYPSSPCGLTYSNTNPNNSDRLLVLDSHSENFREETLIPLYNSSIFQAEAGVERISKESDSDKTDHVAVSLNLFVCRAYPPVQFETKEADLSLKKRKTEASSIQFFPKSSSVDDTHHMQSQMFELINPSSIEELDLELRLGCRPKV